MIRIQLDDATRTELQALRRTTLPPVARDRLEMVLLSAAGWSPPRIAAHLGCYPQTVRKLLHDFTRRGQPALYPGKTGPAPDTDRRDRITGLLRDLLGQDRTWTSAQLAEALAPLEAELAELGQAVEDREQQLTAEAGRLGQWADAAAPMVDALRTGLEAAAQVE